MADKLLICVSAQQATTAHWRRGRIADCRTFANSEAGLALYREFLATFSDVPVYFMVDAVEEDYRFETLPHTYGSDRAALVGRKLKQHYRNTPYVSAWLQGRDSGKRRDDRYLFSALTNPDLIDGWLQAAAAEELPVAGIYLLPMVSGALLDRLQIKAPNLLLVAQHSGGLRLAFFRDGQFRLSRLTRPDSIRGENRERFVADEISNTRLYLHALRAITLDEHLTVLLLDHGDELVETAQGLARDNPSLDCVRLGRHETAAKLGIAEALFEVSPDVIYLHLLGLHTPQSNLAPASATTGHRRHQARRLMHVAATALAIGAIIWTGVNVWFTL
ncbi:MAG: hypothetical protein KIT18_12200, partial [Burkholderiales bacterium]|nr:hypothetical protein [Burkholderiales bacterium]